MRRKKFDCDKAREYSIEKALANLGYFPSRKNEKEAWYLSPFRSENQASFKVSLLLNRWYDHGLGKGGNVIDLIIQLKDYTIPQVLEFLNNDRIDFSFQQPSNFKEIQKEKTYEIVEVKSLGHPALINYLKHRCINLEIARKFCKEIHYQINGKKFFAIAFENRSKGYAIRNKISKMNLLKQDVSIFKNGSDKVCVFEGFIDFLSYLTLYRVDSFKEDFIILNSVSSIKAVIKNLKKYNSVYAYLDNDVPGNEAVIFLKNHHHNVIDCSELYKNHGKDFNEYLMKINNQKG